MCPFEHWNGETEILSSVREENDEKTMDFLEFAKERIRERLSEEAA